MKIFYLDLETSGVDPKKNGLIQLSGEIVIDGEVKERMDLLMRPFPDDVIEQAALDVNKRTAEEIKEFEDPMVVFKYLIDTMNKYVSPYVKADKFHFIGFNSRFDDDFLRAWFRKCEHKYYGSYFHWPAIDVANTAAEKFMEERHKLVNFKLMTVAAYAGIEIDESLAHDAMYDIDITKALHNKLKEIEVSKEVAVTSPKLEEV